MTLGIGDTWETHARTNDVHDGIEREGSHDRLKKVGTEGSNEVKLIENWSETRPLERRRITYNTVTEQQRLEAAV